MTHLGDDQIRVNVVPKKLKGGEKEALTTPLSLTGTADELDADLPKTLVGFVGSHLQLKNTLDNAKAQMNAAAKSAREESRTKAKTAAKAGKPQTVSRLTEEPNEEDSSAVEASKSMPAANPGFFDASVPEPTMSARETNVHPAEEDEILAELGDHDDLEDAA